MNDPKFTPGPWRTDCRLIGGQIRITQVPNANMTVAQVNGRQGEQEANARLIAAAPEMYEALAECVDRIDTFYGPPGSNRIDRELIARARAAIAKAKGEVGDED